MFGTAHEMISKVVLSPNIYVVLIEKYISPQEKKRMSRAWLIGSEGIKIMAEPMMKIKTIALQKR